ncbi:MAG TPA: EamA family transporter [Gammaproteobacteria bacterium]|jgi:O-acetylserine/cysteine efflux transporter|nr:EamA family transporter [Gammaproteobacteria bacterium]
MRLQHLALVLAVVLIWGFNFVVIQVGLTEMSPLTLCVARFFLASIPMVFFIKRPQVPFKYILLYGLVMFALQFTLVFSGMALGVTAGLASLVLQVHVFFTILLAIPFLGERPNRWQTMGALTAFSGIGVVALHLGSQAPLSGFLCIIAAAMAWGCSSLIAKKLHGLNVLILVIWSSMVAWPPLLLITLLFEGPSQMIASLQQVSWLGIGAILYIVYPTTLFGFSIWNKLIREYPVATITPFTLLVPVVGMLSATLVLGEPFESWKLLAGVLVITGLCINLLGPRWQKNKANEHVLFIQNDLTTKKDLLDTH